MYCISKISNVYRVSSLTLLQVRIEQMYKTQQLSQGPPGRSNRAPRGIYCTMGKAGRITTQLSHNPNFLCHTKGLFVPRWLSRSSCLKDTSHLSAVLGIRIRIRIRTKKSRLPNTVEGSTQGTQVANQRATVLVWSNINLPMYFHHNEKSRVQYLTDEQDLLLYSMYCKLVFQRGHKCKMVSCRWAPPPP